jgi:hypothetical protein
MLSNISLTNNNSIDTIIIWLLIITYIHASLLYINDLIFKGNNLFFGLIILSLIFFIPPILCANISFNNQLLITTQDWLFKTNESILMLWLLITIYICIGLSLMYYLLFHFKYSNYLCCKLILLSFMLFIPPILIININSI